MSNSSENHLQMPKQNNNQKIRKREDDEKPSHPKCVVCLEHDEDVSLRCGICMF